MKIQKRIENYLGEALSGIGVSKQVDSKFKNIQKDLTDIKKLITKYGYQVKEIETFDNDVKSLEKILKDIDELHFDITGSIEECEKE